MKKFRESRTRASGNEILKSWKEFQESLDEEYAPPPWLEEYAKATIEDPELLEEQRQRKLIEEENKRRVAQASEEHVRAQQVAQELWQELKSGNDA